MKALSDITIIDLTTAVSGPYCTMMMGDLGAEVIKIEQVKEGDILRRTTPHIQEATPVFAAYNRNKKSVVLDIRSPEGVKLIKKLLKNADVLIDSYQPGTMKEMGLDYDALKGEFPKLVCVSLTGYGKEGPYAQRPVYEGTLQAECGMTQSLINDSQGTPYLVGGSITQYASAYFCMTATLGALHQTHRTGVGQQVDINMYGSLLAMFALPINDYLFNGVECPVDGNAPQGFIRSKDGWLRLSCGDQPIWERAVKLMDDPVLNEPQYNDFEVRNQNRELMLERCELWSRKYTSEEAVHLFTEAGISGGIVRTIADLRKDPHLMARKSIVEIETAGAGKLPYFASPFRMNNSPVDYASAPEMGADTDEVLCARAELDRQEIETLRQAGVIG